MPNHPLKNTALSEEHIKLGGRMVDFGGWNLPVQYSGLADEHTNCRQNAGLFDVSHMGEFHVEGEGAAAFLNYLLTNNVEKVAVGQAQYNVMCHASGGIVDDLVIYRRGLEKFLVVVNASNTDKDFVHFNTIYASVQNRFPNLKIENKSGSYSQIALQGPKSEAILQKLTTAKLSEIRTYWFTETTLLNEYGAIVARTGYTGEDGFEIYVKWEHGPAIWRALMGVGVSDSLKPCGLGARDTLRLEMKYPLYGHELSDTTNPLEAGLGWVTKLDKPDFVGKAALVEAKASGLKRKLVGLKLLDRGIARDNYPIYLSDSSTTPCGTVTSGTHSPSLNCSIAIGYVPTENAAIGSHLWIGVRTQKIKAEVVETPFFRRQNK